MRIKQVLTRILMDRLTPDNQEQMVADLLRRICSDLPPSEQQESIDWLKPKLLTMIRQGRFGLALVIYTHLLRLPPLHWLVISRLDPADTPPVGQLGRLAAKGASK